MNWTEITDDTIWDPDKVYVIKYIPRTLRTLKEEQEPPRYGICNKSIKDGKPFVIGGRFYFDIIGKYISYLILE